MSIIEVKNLTKEYRLGAVAGIKDTLRHSLARLTGKKTWERPRFKALDNVSFSVDAGEVVGIIGHNGAGKSTLLKHLAHITNPTSGNIVVNGSVAPLIEVGAGVNPELTGRENIFLNGAILGIPKKVTEQKLDEIIEFSELEKFIDTPVKRYSSGMTVKLGFSIATSMEADILIVDEVLAVGDLAFQRKCFDRMERLIKREGRTVLLVSHNIRQIERMCDRVLLIDHGRIAMDGPTKQVCDAFYEQNDKTILANQRKKGGDSIKSTGELDLLGMSFVDNEGQDTATITYGSKAKLRVSFRANEIINKPIIIVGFHTTDFVYLATLSSDQLYRSNALSVGEHEAVVTIDDFPLLPGVYSVRLSVDVEEPVKNILYGEGLYHFTVISEELQRTSPKCEGFVMLDPGWDLKSNNESQL